MSLIHVQFLGILTAGLLMWIGNLIRARALRTEAGIHWFRFLLGGVGLSIAVFTAAMLMGERAFSMSVPVLLPVLFGFTSALGLHLLQSRNISAKTALPLILTILLFLSWITLSNNWMVLLLVLLVAVLTALVWFLWEQIEKWYPLIFALEVILLGISIRVTDANLVSEMTPRWLTSIASISAYLVIPWIGVVLSALLIGRLLSNGRSSNWRTVISTLLMVAVLFLMVGYQAVLISMWDVATDGLGWVFLWLTMSTIGIGSAMLMAWSMPRRQLWAAVLFALIVPIVLLEARDLGTYDDDHTWGTTPIITTERRADRIDNAIQRYYEKNNEYPQTLRGLTPRYLLYIPNPYIIPGLNWCYEGGIDHYRFGYVYRQYFSAPASVRIHSTAGEPSDANWGCQDEADKYPAPRGF
jgi:hypothetical protein